MTYTDPPTLPPTSSPGGVPIGVIVPAVVIPVVVIFLCSVGWIVAIVLVFSKKYKAKTMEHEHLTAEMVELKSSSVLKSPGKFGQLKPSSC